MTAAVIPKPPETVDELVDLAIRGDRHGVEGGSWPRVRVPVPDGETWPAAVRWVCHCPPDPSPERNDYVSMVILHIQAWYARGETWRVWLGQCPGCRTVYYALHGPSFREPK